MTTDRYLRIVLTVIALELAWLGIRDVAPPVSAQQPTAQASPQQPTAPIPVVIRGIDLPADAEGALPVALVAAGTTVRVVAARPLPIETAQPLKIEADRPLVVETRDRPLQVQSVPYVPGRLPGD